MARHVVTAMLLAVAAVSLVSFLRLAGSVGGYNAQVGRVVNADLVALVCIVVGAVARGLSPGDGA